jgi:uncharacterized protein YchJ
MYDTEKFKSMEEFYQNLKWNDCIGLNSTPIRVQKTNRNDPCPCGSGKKHKKCCGLIQQYTERQHL